MKLAIVGQIDGKLNKLYSNLLPEKPDWILCTGSFGVWPDPAKIDRATRQKGGEQDFAKLYIDDYNAPIQTLFVSGVHEDHQWLEARYRNKNTEVIDNIYWLANGYKTHIGDLNETVRVSGLGKAYSEKTYKGEITKKSSRHYTKGELERGCTSGPTDILLLHSSPDNPGIRTLIFATRPKLIVHYSLKPIQYEIQHIPTYGILPQQVLYFDYNYGIVQLFKHELIK